MFFLTGHSCCSIQSLLETLSALHLGGWSSVVQKFHSSEWNEAEPSTSPGSTWFPSPRSRNLRPAKACRCDEGKERWRPEDFLRSNQGISSSSSDPKNTWEQDSLRPLVFECVCLACDPNASNRQALLLYKCARLKLWSNTCNSKVLWDCQSKLQLIKHQSVGDPGPRHRQTHCDHSNHSHQHKQHMPKKSKNVGIIAFPCCCNYLCKRDHEILPGFGSLDIEIVVRCCCTVAHNKTSNQTHVW